MPLGFKMAATTPRGPFAPIDSSKNNQKIINLSILCSKLAVLITQSLSYCPLSTICCIEGFHGILSKTFSEHCSFYNEIYHKQLKILVALHMAEMEVKFRGQHQKTVVFNI